MKNKNVVKVGELKVGDRFKPIGLKFEGVCECVRAYWAEARNPAYRAAAIKIVEITHLYDPSRTYTVDSFLSFNHRTKVELL